MSGDGGAATRVNWTERAGDRRPLNGKSLCATGDS